MMKRTKLNFNLSSLNSHLSTINGFTLIELLVVILVIFSVGVLISSILFSALRGANKTNTIDLVRRNGNSAITQMSRMIRYSQSFDGVSTDGVAYTTSCISLIAVIPPVISSPSPHLGLFPKLTNLIQESVNLGKKEVSSLFSKLALIPKFGQGGSLLRQASGQTVPTRFYLPTSGAPVPALSPAFSADWEDTTVGVRLRTRTTVAGTVMKTVSFADKDDTSRDILFYQYISDPIEAVTITNPTIKFQIRGRESNLLNNMFTALHIRVVAPNGTLRGNILSVTRDDLELALSDAPFTNRRFIAIPVVMVTAQAFDRIVIELGTGGAPGAGGTHDSDLRIGESVSSVPPDLPEDDTTAFDGGGEQRPWVELSTTISFNPSLTPTPTPTPPPPTPTPTPPGPTPTPTPAPPTPTPIQYHYARVTGFDGGKTTFHCDKTDTVQNPLGIASNSASLIDTSSVDVSSCYFTCSQGNIISPPNIGINFNLTQKGTPKFFENKDTASFQTSVSVRNY